MAFDAGSVIGHFTLDTGGYVDGANKVNKSTTGMTGSILKANVAYDLLKKGISFVIQVFKESVGKWNEASQVLAQTNAVLKSTGGIAGMTAQSVSNLANSLQKTTTFSEDTVQSAENLLLTFTKIGKDIFPEATSTVLDMATALKEDTSSAAMQLGKALQDPITGVQALRRVGINFTQSQQDMIKTMVQTGKTAQAQKYILKELETEFGGSAAAARNTFGGSMKALENVIDQTQETIGHYIAVAGKPFVDSMIKSAEGTNEWLNSAQGIQTIGSILEPVVGIFSVGVQVGKELFNMLVNLGSGILDDIKTGFQNIFGQGNQANTVFLVLGYTVKIVSIAFTILGKIIKGVIDWNVNLVKIAVASTKTLVALGDAMLHPLDPSKWKTLGTNATETMDAIKKTGIDAFTDVKNTITSTVDSFKILNVDAKATADQLQNTYNNAVVGIHGSLAKFNNTVTTGNAAIVSNTNDTTSNVKKSWLETFNALSQQTKDTVANFGLFSNEGRQAINELVAHVADGMQKVGGAINDGIAGISQVYSAYYDNQLADAEADYNRKKAYIEANVTDETDRNNQLAALDAEYQAKQADIKTKQFQAQKVASVTQAIIATANAVMTSFAQFGWPFGLIPAAIMAGIGAAQIAVIASQPTPSFAAEGGVFNPGKPIIVGEQGPEMITLGSTSRIVPNDQTKSILGNSQNQSASIVSAPLTIQIDGTPIYKGLLRATKQRIALIDGGAVI